MDESRLTGRTSRTSVQVHLRVRAPPHTALFHPLFVERERTVGLCSITYGRHMIIYHRFYWVRLLEGRVKTFCSFLSLSLSLSDTKPPLQSVTEWIKKRTQISQKAGQKNNTPSCRRRCLCPVIESALEGPGLDVSRQADKEKKTN